MRVVSTPGILSRFARRWPPITWVLLAVGVGAVLWLLSSYSYLLFHAFAEIFGVVIACTVFLFSWSSRAYPEQRPFVLLGIGYLFVAIINVLHMLTYQGMTVLSTTQDYATRLWIAGRGLQALVSLAFAISLRLRRPPKAAPSFLVVGIVATVLVLSIFWWDVFPLCFVEGQGITPFKRAAEYAISAVLAAAIVIVALEPDTMGRKITWLLVSAFATNIVSELTFTLYLSSYGFPNLLGHYLMVASFYLSYEALFATRVRARMQLIQELQSSKAELEDRNRELAKANVSKDKFFSIISHDLRNPIGGILNVAELLAKRFDRLDREIIRGLTGSLYEASRHSAELLESILHWARAHTGRITASPSCIHLAELCEGVAAVHRGPAAAKGVSILSCVSGGPVAYADENMLATVLRNLVSNGVKFTPAGGKVVLRAVEEGTWVNLTVEDTGVGMSPEDLGKLFRIDVHFTRPGTALEPGNGLGLILCKELLALNHGEILAESSPGKGSVFTVRLPRGAGCGEL